MDRLSAGESDRLAQLIGSDQRCRATDALESWQGEGVSFCTVDVFACCPHVVAAPVLTRHEQKIASFTAFRCNHT